MGQRVSILGVPTSAGSHNAGQEKAPAAWRTAGLAGALRAAGLDVEDRGDGRLPIVLGGDCTITLGVLAGSGEAGLVYFDGDADLSTPAHTDSAVADTMGMTHMLGGGSSRLAGLGSRSPLLRPDQVVLFGFDPAELDTRQWTELVSRHLYAAPVPAVRTDPAGQARAALGYLQARVDSYLVHLDVDVLHTGLFPVANFPHFAGLTLDEAGACLEEFTSGEKFGGLVITEVNPDHDPDGQLLPQLVRVVADALARTAEPAAAPR